MLFPQTSQIMYLTILAHLIKQSSLQSIIYSITRINSSQDIKSDEAIITTAITSSTFRPLSQNASSTTTVDKQAKIYVRSKRHNMQKMPRLPKLDPNESTENGELKDRQNISLVLAQLLNHYDHNQRPGYGGPPASITTNLEIRSMGPISELDMEYSLDCYFRQKWEDERLRFKGNTTYLSLNIKMLDKIWKPDTYFHTGKGSHLHMITTPNKFLRIFQNGLVLYSMRLTIKSLCPMDLHSFPMDKQSCPLILGSYGYPNDQLVYSWDKKPVTFNKKDFTLSQFDIVKTIYRNGTFIFKRGNHSMLQVNFNLRRHVGYFLIQIYVPCSLIVVLSWVSFWINREATADRVGLGVTSVLTLSTFGLDSRSDLPRVSYATALDWFTIMCFLFVVFTLLQFAGVHYFTKVGTGEVPMIEIDDEESTSGSNACSDEEDGIEVQSHRNRTFSDSRRYYNWNQQQSKVRRRKLKPKGNQVMRGKMMKGKLKQHKANSDQFPSEYEMQYSYNSCNQLYPDNQQFIQNDFEYNVKVEDDPNRCHLIGNHMPKAISNSDNYDSFHMPYCPKNPAYQEYLRFTELNKDNANFESSNVDLDFSRMSYLENYLNKRLKQSSRNLVYPMNNRNYNHNSSQVYNDAAKLTSSWPTLAWKNLPDNCKHNRQTIGEIENYVDDCTEVGDCYQRPGDNETDDNQSVQDNSWINVWKSIIYPMSHCCLEFWYCFTVNEEYKQEMRRRRTPNVSGMSAVNSVSRIDKVSRILFPLVFFILNISYWIFYINERNAEFNQWESGIIIY